MNFRRQLKLWLKDIDRKLLTSNNLLLELQGLGLTFTNLMEVIRVIKQPHAKARGRQFTKLGRAALKQKSLVFIKDISDYAQRGFDLRNVPFYYKTCFHTVPGNPAYSFCWGSELSKSRKKSREALNLDHPMLFDSTYETNFTPSK